MIYDCLGQEIVVGSILVNFRSCLYAVTEVYCGYCGVEVRVRIVENSLRFGDIGFNCYPIIVKPGTWCRFVEVIR